MKDELDKVFKEIQYSNNMNPSEVELSFSKIKKLKLEMLKAGVEEGIEFTAVALSFVLLEKLIFLKKVVTKENRKLYAGVCVLLATKFEDHGYAKNNVDKLLKQLEEVFKVPAKEFVQHELQLFSELEFSLFVPQKHISPHLRQIFSLLNVQTIKTTSGAWITTFTRDHPLLQLL